MKFIGQNGGDNKLTPHMVATRISVDCIQSLPDPEFLFSVCSQRTMRLATHEATLPLGPEPP